MDDAQPRTMAHGVDLADPASFTHWVRDVVRFCDQDASGHVNNTKIAQYVESGRLAYLHGLLKVREARARFIAARLAIDYLREAHYPGDVQVGTRLLRIGNRSITGGCGLFKDEVCFATATWVVAYLRDGKTAPLPDSIREILESAA